MINWQQQMQQSLRLMRREMRHGMRGFGVFLGCLFLGVFAISAIGNFTAAARSGILNDASSLLGGDLEIRQVHRPLAEQQLNFIQQRGNSSEVIELRTMAVAHDIRKLVELKAVDHSYPLYGELKLSPSQPLNTALDKQNGLWGAIVERAFLQRFSLAVGDIIQLGKTSFSVRGILDIEPDRAVRAFTLGPRVMISTAGLQATELVQPGSLINYAYRLRLPDRHQAEALKTELQQKFPDAGWRLRSWREAAPRIRYFLDRMGTNLTLLGLCSLLVGGLGVTGAVRGYFNSKISHIATMKCLGATQGMIFSTYLLQILFLGAVGSAAGLLVGAALPWALDYFLAEQLPIPLASGFFPRVWLTTLLFGLLTTVLFSLKELGTACETPPAVLFRGYRGVLGNKPKVRIWGLILITTLLLIALAIYSSSERTLACWFISGAGLCFLLFRLLSWGVIRLSRRLPHTTQPSLRLALANMHRPGSPAAGIIFSLGIGLTALVMIVQIQSNLNDMVSESLPANAPAFFFFDIQKNQLDSFKQLTDSTPTVTRFSYSPTLRGRITAVGGIPIEQAKIDPEVRWAINGDRFLSYAAKPPEKSILVEGQWWSEDYHGPALISLTDDLARGFHVSIGDTLSVNILGRTVTAQIANLRQVDWSTLELNFAIIFAPGALESAPQTYIAAVHLPEPAEEAFYQQVTKTFANVSALSVREVLVNVSRTLERIGWAFKGMAVIALASGFLVLSGAISADQHRRVRDAVILKVCGATRRNIITTFAAEFIFLGFVAGAISLISGSLAALAIIKGPLQSSYQFHPLLISATLFTGILLILLFGLLGTWKALGHKPSTYLRKQ